MLSCLVSFSWIEALYSALPSHLDVLQICLQCSSLEFNAQNVLYNVCCMRQVECFESDARRVVAINTFTWQQNLIKLYVMRDLRL